MTGVQTCALPICRKVAALGGQGSDVKEESRELAYLKSHSVLCPMTNEVQEGGELCS